MKNTDEDLLVRKPAAQGYAATPENDGTAPKNGAANDGAANDGIDRRNFLSCMAWACLLYTSRCV